ncbi:MAG: DUF6429 family protein [Xanthomonadales bacterium]|nr:DUF6429 family protein [Xanthomonadales bacterium]
MLYSDEIDETKLAEVALAILSLSATREKYGSRVWKSMDWDLMQLLFENDWISNPVGKQKSVVLTEQGEELAALFLKKHFTKSPAND